MWWKRAVAEASQDSCAALRSAGPFRTRQTRPRPDASSCGRGRSCRSWSKISQQRTHTSGKPIGALQRNAHWPTARPMWRQGCHHPEPRWGEAPGAGAPRKGVAAVPLWDGGVGPTSRIPQSLRSILAYRAPKKPCPELPETQHLETRNRRSWKNRAEVSWREESGM